MKKLIPFIGKVIARHSGRKFTSDLFGKGIIGTIIATVLATPATNPWVVVALTGLLAAEGIVFKISQAVADVKNDGDPSRLVNILQDLGNAGQDSGGNVVPASAIRPALID